MRPVLLLDFDHTLYPPTLPTLGHIDRRITLYIETFLGLDFAAADAMRQNLCSRHGTTLRGLMHTHQLDPHHYFDFVHQVDEACLPPADAGLRLWLEELSVPAYVFTNARADWVWRCFENMRLTDLVGEGRPLLAILDLAFADWVGKPQPSAYAAVENLVRQNHGADAVLHLVDDRQDNLLTARERGWQTHWFSPHAPEGESALRSLADLKLG